MACIIKSERLQKIFDLIKAVSKDSDLGINTYDDLLSYFSKEIPGVSSTEIHQALLPVDELKRTELKDDLKRTQGRLKRLSYGVKKLNEILKREKTNKEKGATEEELKEIQKIIGDINKLAGIDVVIPPEAYSEIVGRLENAMILRDAYFSLDGPVSESHIERAVEHLNNIKRLAKINEIDQKIQDIDGQMEKLNNTEELEFGDIENIDTTVKFKGLDREIAEKQRELDEKRIEFEIELKRIRRKKIAEKGIFGIKSPGTQKAAELALLFKEAAWEPWRALKFMGDISAWGVQAAPVVYSLMTDVNMKAALRGDLGAAFESQRELGRIFYETTLQVILDGARSVSNRGKTAKSKFAEDLLLRIKREPSYVVAKAAGLHISESGSLTNSEEVFTSRLLNKFSVFGALKDISEDTMVSTLNALRMLKFRTYWDATDGALSIEEYTKAADLINKMTGTLNTKGIESSFVGFASYFMSAPKLLLSRLKLATSEPIKAVKGIDLPQSVKNKKFMFQSEADRFRFREMVKMVRGYAATAFLLSLIPGIDYEDDPTETNFMRYTLDRDLAVDATGGIGTLYRTISKAMMLTFGAPEGASYNTKDKIEYLKNVQKENGLDALLTGFVKYKLHPTITSAHSVMTGKDFFGDGYSLLGKEGVGPHIEGMIRAVLPISAEQGIDDIRAITVGDQSIGESSLASALQFIGFNTFRYDSNMADMRVVDYFNKAEYVPQVRYPDLLQGDNTNTGKYYKNKYKKIWGDIMGEMIVARGANADQLTKVQISAISKVARKKAIAQFNRKYGPQIKKLKNK